MSLAVQSYPELYTLLIGWNLYDQIWELLTETGLAYLPFIGMVLRNMAQPYISQETKDAGSTSLRRLEVDIIGTMLLLFFAVSPMLLLNPRLVEYTPLCPSEGKNTTVHPGDTGTTFDKAFTLPTQEIRVPLWWYAVMATSQGITNAANMMVACVPDLRKMVTQVDMTQIPDVALKRELQQFNEECFIPARTRYFSDISKNAPAISLVESNLKRFGVGDTEWYGSHGFSQGYYAQFQASRPIKGFPYIPSQDLNADSNTLTPAFGAPICDRWWNDAQHGLKTRLAHTLPPNFWEEFRYALDDEKKQDAVIKRVLFNSQPSGYDKANNMIGDWGYSHVAAGLGEWFQQLDTYPKLYAAAQAAPIIQSLLLMMVYAFMPLALFFTSYRPASFISGAIIIFSLIFWSFIWRLVSWTDATLMNALYGSNWFAHQTPNATLVDLITGTLIIVAPLFWFSFMTSMGVAVGNFATLAFNSLSKPSDESAETGAKFAKKPIKKIFKD